MTETQAKSGTAGAPANPVDEEAAGSATTPAGRSAVGRAAVPTDAPSPKFTRAPGMPPPPDKPAGEAGDRPAEPTEAVDVSATPVVSAAAPVPTGGEPPTTPVTGPVVAAAAAPPGATGGRAGGPGSDPTERVGPAGQAPLGSGRVSGSARLTTPVVNPARTAAGAAAAVGAARVTEAVRAARGSVGSAASRGPRRARLNVKRIDPWSVMKFSFAVSLVLFIVVIVATSVLYLALDAMGVFESVNSSLTDLISAGGGPGENTFRITARGVILTSALIGLVNVVLFTALATLGAFVYNVCADLVGGIELTLAERD